MSEPTIYDRIGGESAIQSIIDDFYQRIVNDSVLSSYFKNANVDKIMAMQKHFFTMATGGPLTYSGRSLREVHKPLGISRYEFDRYVHHLVDTLRDLNISDEEAKQVVACINLYAPDITNDVDPL